jgi:hypothetical protein
MVTWLAMKFPSPVETRGAVPDITEAQVPIQFRNYTAAVPISIPGGTALQTDPGANPVL